MCKTVIFIRQKIQSHILSCSHVIFSYGKIVVEPRNFAVKNYLQSINQRITNIL